MAGPFTSTVSTTEKCKKLQEVENSEDAAAILIHADPDSIASAFRYLYKYSNLNIIKKVESSEITKKTLPSFQLAFKRLTKTNRRHSPGRSARCGNTGDNSRFFYEDGGGHLQHCIRNCRSEIYRHFPKRRLSP